MREIMSSEAINEAMNRMADEILIRNKDHKSLTIVGIFTRGVSIAKKLKGILEQKTGIKDIPFGTIDITLYRDDVSEIYEQPKAKGAVIDFEVTNKNIILVDDVLYTGRTVRAALDEIIDFGRPATIQLLTMVDRGGHEFPITADYCGYYEELVNPEYVKVKVADIDGVDLAIVESR